MFNAQPIKSSNNQIPTPNVATLIICDVVAMPATITLDSRKAPANDLARTQFIDGLIDKLNQHPTPLDEEQSWILLKHFVKQNCREMVSALLKKGAQYIFQRQEYSPFHLALLQPTPDPKMVEIFVSHDPRLVNFPAFTGESPLSLVVFAVKPEILNDSLQIIKMLLEYDVDPYEKTLIHFNNNDHNMSAMDFAIRGGFSQIIKALAREIKPSAERDIQSLLILDKFHGRDLTHFRLLLTTLCQIGYVSSTPDDVTQLGMTHLREILTQVDTKKITCFSMLEKSLKHNENARRTLMGALNTIFYQCIKNVRSRIVTMTFEEILSMKELILQYCDIQNGKNPEFTRALQNQYIKTCKEFFPSFIQESRKFVMSLDAVKTFLEHIDELTYCAKISASLKHVETEKFLHTLIAQYNLEIIRHLEQYLSSSQNSLREKDYYSLELLNILKKIDRDDETFKGKHNLLNRAQGICLMIQALLSEELNEISRATTFVNSYSYLGFTELNEWPEFKKLKNAAKTRLLKRKHNASPKMNESKAITPILEDETITSTTALLLASELPLEPVTATLTIITPQIAKITIPETGSPEVASPNSELKKTDLAESRSSPTIHNDSPPSSPSSSVITRQTIVYDKSQNFLSQDEKKIVDLFGLPNHVQEKLIFIPKKNRWAYFELDPEDFDDASEHNRFFSNFKNANPHFVKVKDLEQWVVTLDPGGIDARVFATEQIKQDARGNSHRLLRFNRIGNHSDYNKPMGSLHYKL